MTTGNSQSSQRLQEGLYRIPNNGFTNASNIQVFRIS